MENVSNLFGFLGGLGMFLYGMHLMAEGMQKTAGGKMQSFLEMLTNNRVMAIGLGALITAIIQSSGATTVMVVGFVSAGIMTLSQAVGVIMGANIGTTITAWIVSMSQLGEASAYLTPDFYAPVMIGIGAILLLFAKSNRKKTVGEILIGLGLLFMGLRYMSGSISPYTDAPIFAQAFTLLGSNPILGIIVGCLVTALLQSSSASVGILQTLAMNGVVTTNAAIFLTLGQNIGSCVTALLSSIGGSRTAKRAAVIHLSFNVIGAILVGSIGFIFFMLYPAIAAHHITSVEISIFHTVFNTFMTAILFPFADRLVDLSGIIVKEKPEQRKDITDAQSVEMLKHLDDRILETPAFAVDTASKQIVQMGEITLANVQRALNTVVTGDVEEIEKVSEVEKTINNMETMLTEYLIKIDKLALTDSQTQIVNDLFYTVTDIERIGDHAENVAENAKQLVDKHLKLSQTGMEDLKDISDTVYQSCYYAIKARSENNLEYLRKVNQYEDRVDSLEEELRDKHIDRLSSGACNPQAGIVFLDIISNLERISDHAMNIAGYLKKEI